MVSASAAPAGKLISTASAESITESRRGKDVGRPSARMMRAIAHGLEDHGRQPGHEDDRDGRADGADEARDPPELGTAQRVSRAPRARATSTQRRTAIQRAGGLGDVIAAGCPWCACAVRSRNGPMPSETTWRT